MGVTFLKMSTDWKTGRARILRDCPVGSVVILPTNEIITVKRNNFCGVYKHDTVFYVADAKVNIGHERVCHSRALILKYYLKLFEIAKSTWVLHIILRHFKEIKDSVVFHPLREKGGRLCITQCYKVAIPRRR